MVAAMTSGSVPSFRGTLVEEIALGAPRLQGSLHQRRGDGLSKKPSEV
jgi:hypothetical protein